MAATKTITYFSTTILKAMNKVEELTGKPFQETSSRFEDAFWQSHNAKDLHSLERLEQTINKTIVGLEDNKTYRKAQGE